MPDTAPFRQTALSLMERATIYRQEGYDHIWIWALKYNPETHRREYVEHLCTDWPYTDNFNLTGDLYIPQVADTTYYGNPAPSKLYPMLEGTPLHKRFLRLDLTKVSDDTRSLIISGDFEGKFFDFRPFDHFSNWHDEPYDDEGYLVAAATSADYDKYLRDAIYFKELSESSDLSSSGTTSSPTFTEASGYSGHTLPRYTCGPTAMHPKAMTRTSLDRYFSDTHTQII